jgi:hypothetical protein
VGARLSEQVMPFNVSLPVLVTVAVILTLTVLAEVGFAVSTGLQLLTTLIFASIVEADNSTVFKSVFSAASLARTTK